MVRNLLRNENYIGINVYNRSNERLGQKNKANPPNVWIRSVLNDEFVLAAIAQNLRRPRRWSLGHHHLRLCASRSVGVA